MARILIILGRILLAAPVACLVEDTIADWVLMGTQGMRKLRRRMDSVDFANPSTPTCRHAHGRSTGAMVLLDAGRGEDVERSPQARSRIRLSTALSVSSIFGFMRDVSMKQSCPSSARAFLRVEVRCLSATHGVAASFARTGTT
jgi:hypothetical protein